MKSFRFYFAIAVVLYLCAGCLPKPDGGFYWALKYHAPVLAGGDGQTYETAYYFRHSNAESLRYSENKIIHYKYWITPQRPYEDFWHIVPPAKVSCADSIQCLTVSRGDKIYDVVTFELPEGTRTLYFDVTKYRRKKEH